jgi:hypothetical protein
MKADGTKILGQQRKKNPCAVDQSCIKMQNDRRQLSTPEVIYNEHISDIFRKMYTQNLDMKVLLSDHSCADIVQQFSQCEYGFVSIHY